ncbi:MAG: peptidoglycan-binding protein, partial [Planctomycetes bacterium]|nr:peptidoglycan-binding protein [Planctomycetota bacterium]
MGARPAVVLELPGAAAFRPGGSALLPTAPPGAVGALDALAGALLHLRPPAPAPAPAPAPVPGPGPAPPAPAPAPAVTPPGVTLRQGSKGADVRTLQERLVLHGAAIDVDGDFGPKTRAAVVAFQQARGLDADGVVGKLTWGELCQAPPAPP